MDLFSTLYIGRETMMGHGAAIATVSDNIANLNTTGFKGQRSEFGDLLADSIGSLYGSPLNAGQGSFLENLATDLSQGSVETTGRGLDFAIDGRGYFVVQDSATTQLYTRAGNFTVDSEGNLATIDGKLVLGISPTDPNAFVPLNLTNIGAEPSATTTMTLNGNLDATSPLTTPPTNPSSFVEINRASSFASPVEVIDSLGQPHGVLLHFFHTEASKWTVEAYVDAVETGGEEGTPVRIGSATLTFGENGTQAAGGTALTLSATWGNGSAASSVAADLSAFTGFAAPSAIGSVVSDGASIGEVTGFTVDSSGVLQAQLSNGQNSPIGTLAMATFTNAGGLDRAGSNSFRATEDSGVADIGAALTEGRGTVNLQQLESSNVDQATEFIRMIQLQRAYQAGSQVVQTASRLISDTIQIL